REDREFLLGDLDESFERSSESSRPRAILLYMADAAHAAWTRRTPASRFDTKGSITVGITQDIRYAVRNLLKHRSFTAVALLTPALGIGANTAVFSVIRHVLLAPLPYRDAPRLVDVWSKWRGYDKTWASDADALDYQQKIDAFESAGAWDSGQVNITGDG